MRDYAGDAIMTCKCGVVQLEKMCSTCGNPKKAKKG